MRLNEDFYLNEDVVEVAQLLIGKVLHTRLDGQHTAGIITETEAYNGIVDKASHAYGNRRTARTEVMYKRGGCAYVYLCYGIHSLFNVVTNQSGIPHAVLVRAIRPLEGIPIMEARRRQHASNKRFSSGPGSVSQAMGIHFSHTGLSLTGNKIWIADTGIRYSPSQLKATPRIGVDYAGEDALLPYRFIVDSR